MKVKSVYPAKEKRSLQRHEIINVVKWPFMFSAYICPILNICVGGKAWSVIVLWSLYFAWSMILSPDLVEFNRISQFIKLVAYSCILLILIDLLLVPGWAVEVVPIVCFCGLISVGVLFFTDLNKQTQNMLPMLLLIAVTLISAIIGLLVWHEESRWALVVMGAISFALLVACISVLGNDFMRELEKRFHTR